MTRTATLLLLFSFLTLSLPSFGVILTFQVDMSRENISPDGVHVAGNFQALAGFASDWNPGATPLTDSDGDHIYEVSVDLPPGTYFYKFINGDAWSDKPELPPAACAFSDGGGNFNRQVVLGSQALSLPVLVFDSCQSSIEFRVNMKGQVLSPDGIYATGDFLSIAGLGNDWEAKGLRLNDADGDSLFTATLPLPPGEYHYLYVNGDSSSKYESLGVGCGNQDSSGRWVRSIGVSSGLSQTPLYCFGGCQICDPSISENYDLHWWNDAVFYEIFVRSFYDSDGDGIGDFQGIIQKLDYLNDGDPTTKSDLGITGIWLMPMMESPSYHGYDVTDYYKTEPDYGTMADFEALLDSCHARGIKVIIDFVMNHSSNQHPWFTQSANNQNGFRDWYIWSNTDPGFLGPWGQQVWHPRNGDYYYGLFWGGMPDLNYSHPPVKEEMFDITRFWLNKGVDGFRLDAIKYLDEDGTILENTPETFTLLEEFNQVYKTENPQAFTVGEVWSGTSSILPYVEEDRLDVCFDFDLAYGIINGVYAQQSSPIDEQIRIIEEGYDPLQYATFLTNHDIDRIYSQMGQDDARMKLAASIYLSLPGIPFVYYGEEIGMVGTGIHENIRRPMQWSDAAHAGFSTQLPWYGLGPNYLTHNVEAMNEDPASLLSHYRQWIHLRNDIPALRRGYLRKVSSAHSSLLSFIRIHQGEAVLVLANMGEQPLANLSLDLDISSLLPGNYAAREITEGKNLDSLAILSEGGFQDWNPEGIPLGPRSSKAFLISKNITVSKQPLLSNIPSLRIYPNPSTDQVAVQLEGRVQGEVAATLMDIEGRVLMEKEWKGDFHRFSVSSLAPGLYFLHVRTGGHVISKKLMVRK